MGIIPLTPRGPGLELKNIRICTILVQKCSTKKDSRALHYRDCTALGTWIILDTLTGGHTVYRNQEVMVQ